VSVSDKTWPDVTSTAQVDVIELHQDALQQAASIRLSSESHSDDMDVKISGKKKQKIQLSYC